MPRITIDVELPYEDYFINPEEDVVIEDVEDEDEDESEEFAVTCPTCGAVITEEVEAD